MSSDSRFSLLSTLLPPIPSHIQKRRIRHHLQRTNKLLKAGIRPRIFIAVKNVNWEQAALVDSWKAIADVVHFEAHEQFDQYQPQWHHSGKAAFNRLLLDTFMREHHRKPFDLFFSYLSGRWVTGDTIKKISQSSAISCNYGFDDSQSFFGRREEGGWSGNAEICRSFDFCITAQSPRDVVKYHMRGGRALFLPSAGNATVFAAQEPSAPPRQQLISFVGQKTPQRSRLVEQLRGRNIELTTAGKGWELGSVTTEQFIELTRTSLIALGVGYYGNSTRTRLKGRDFEIPLIGTAYLTSWNRELSHYFKNGEEILMYRSTKQLYSHICRLRDNPDLAERIGQAGRQRALAQHCWHHRWQQILELCSEQDFA
jgi:hypothetical protein